MTKVNGVVKQDGNTKNLIWDEAHMIRYLSSILTLYPGDVISSGTPDGVGAGRKPPEFLKPGDVVTIDIDGIGTLTTPMRALAAPGIRDARSMPEGRRLPAGTDVGADRRRRWLTSRRHSPLGAARRRPQLLLTLFSSTVTSSPSTRGSRRAGDRHLPRKIHGSRRNGDIRKLAGPSTTIIDLKGRTVIPGLADDHLHDAGGGTGVDLSRARSLADVLRAIAARVKQSRPGDIVITNSDWHEAQLKEHRLPYRRDLDTVSPDNPVVVVRGGHEYILNSAALKKWNITKETPQLPGGRITRDAAGELNGELVDRAKSLVHLPPAPPDHRGAAGTAPKTERGGPDQHSISGRVGRAVPAAPGNETPRYADDAGQSADAVRRRQRTDDARRDRGGNIKPDEGDEWVRVGGMKLGVDGGFEGGWMRQPYAEPWGEGGTFFGVNTMKQAPYTDVVKELNRLGWRVATHAVGDAAIDEVLAAYEAADAEKSIVRAAGRSSTALSRRPISFRA